MKRAIDRLSIAQKISLGYSLSLGVAICGSLAGVFVGDYYQNRAQEHLEIADRQQHLVLELENAVSAMRLHPQRLTAVLGDSIWFDYEAAKFRADANRVNQVVRDFEQFIDRYESESDVNADKLNAILEKYRNTTAEYKVLITELWEQIDPPSLKAAEIPDAQQQVVRTLSRPRATAIQVSFDRLLEHLMWIEDVVESQYQTAQYEQRQAETLRRQIVFGSIGLSVALSVALVLVTSRAIARPLQAVERVAHDVTRDSNFDLRCPVTTADEVGSLARSFNQLIQRIGEYTHCLESEKNRADAASRAKSEFLANMSHELRTPLNGILGYAQILQRSPDLNQQRQGVEIIHQCGSHLLTLINDILDLSKIEARKMELHPQDVHFPSLLTGIAEICQIRATEKDLSFTFRSSEDLPVNLRVDEKRLRQLLINLLGNAVKYTQHGGVVFSISRVETPSDSPETPKEGSQETPTQRIRFQIEDTGIGMTPEQLEKIFLPFEQVGESHRIAEGTGLGLAIAQKIVGLMGGEIQVRSVLGEGSCFWFELDIPVANREALARSRSPSGAIGYEGRKRKILLVDDKAQNRAILVSLLEPLGFEILQADDGQAGLETAKRERPDLILTDLVMPVLDGFEMMRRIRQVPELRDVKIIASSASVFESDRNQSSNAGSDDFLPRPVQLDRLLQILEEQLELKWIYRASPTATCQAVSDTHEEERAVTGEWIVPPPEVLESLLHSARRGSLKRIVKQCEALQRDDPKYAAFSQRLIQLAQNFQEKSVLLLLEEQCMEKVR